MNRSSRRAVAGMIALGAVLLAGCSSDDEPKPKPADPLVGLQNSLDDDVESQGTVFEEKGTGPTTLTVDVPEGVQFVQVGGTCSPAQLGTDSKDLPFGIDWGEAAYATQCDPKSPSATGTIDVKRIGSDHTFKVKIAEGVAWRVAGISVPDPDAD